MELTSILPIVAAILYLAAVVLYNIQILNGKSKPNAISWGIWALLAIVNAFSYGAMIDNWVAALQFFAGTIACIITFIVGLLKKSYEKPTNWQWAIAAICLVAIFVWILFRSATGANMVVLVAFVFSFIPTLTGVFNDPRKERSLPWAVWTAAFTVTLFNIILLDKEWMAYLIPGGGLLGHALVGLLVMEKRKKVFEQGIDYKSVW